MSATITAPDNGFSGVIAGVMFVNGVSKPVEVVPDYFHRHTGYTVNEQAPAREPQKPVARGRKPTKS